MLNVIMSAFNAENTIEQAMDSLLRQTQPAQRIIIVDDASTDQTAELLKQYVSEQVIVVRNSKNAHVAGSLNRALEYLSSDCQFVARMDADDVCQPERFKLQLAFLKANESVDFVGSFVTEFFESGESLKSFPDTLEGMRAALLFRSPFCHPSIMFRASMITEGLYDPDFLGCEDHALWAKLLLKDGAIGANLTTPLLRYRRHEAQVTSSSLSPAVACSLYRYILSLMDARIEERRFDLFVSFLRSDFSRIRDRSDALLSCLSDLYDQVAVSGEALEFEREVLRKWLRFCRSYKSRRGLKLYLKLCANLSVEARDLGAIKLLLHDVGIPGRRMNKGRWCSWLAALLCPIQCCRLTRKRF